jgi:hypothetical protein
MSAISIRCRGLSNYWLCWIRRRPILSEYTVEIKHQPFVHSISRTSVVCPSGRYLLTNIDASRQFVWRVRTERRVCSHTDWRDGKNFRDFFLESNRPVYFSSLLFPSLMMRTFEARAGIRDLLQWLWDSQFWRLSIIEKKSQCPCWRREWVDSTCFRQLAAALITTRTGLVVMWQPDGEDRSSLS